MAIQSKHLVLLALIVLPGCVSSSGTQSPIHALEMAGSSRETAVAATSTAASSQSTSTAAAVATSNASQATETQHAFNITSTADYAAVQAYATQHCR